MRLVLAFVLTVGSAAAAADLPLAVRLATGSASRAELTNTGTQPVNAWSLAITTPAGEGRTHRTVQTVDGYLTTAMRGVVTVPEKFNPLSPGETRQIELEPLPPDASASVVAVVLEDNTAVGDADVIRGIFERRIKERDELGRVVEVVNAVLASARGIPALQELKRRFDEASAPDESTAHRAAREAVDSYITRATAENADQIEQLLRGYLALVVRQHDEASRHAVRKEPAPAIP